MKNYIKSLDIRSMIFHIMCLIILISTVSQDTISQSQKKVKGKASSQKSIAPVSANKAISQAQESNKYLVVLFYDKKDNSFQEMQKTVQAFSKTSATPIRTYEALTTDSKESDVIQKYGINRAPLPVLLVFAPNGAITGGFPQKVTKEQLTSCMVPKLIMNILKSVQAQKVALVLLQNNNTKFNNETMDVANELSKDQRLLGYVDIIKHDPTDGDIKEFLTQCKIESTTKEAATVVIVPPGKIGGVYSGKTTKETLISCLASCSGGGCSPSGCGPKK